MNEVVFFLAAAVCMIGFDLALMTDAIDPRYTQRDLKQLRRIMYLTGFVGNVSLLTLYTLTRTVGIPFGPGAGTVEVVRDGLGGKRVAVVITGARNLVSITAGSPDQMRTRPQS